MIFAYPTSLGLRSRSRRSRAEGEYTKIGGRSAQVITFSKRHRRATTAELFAPEDWPLPTVTPVYLEERHPPIYTPLLPRRSDIYEPERLSTEYRYRTVEVTPDWATPRYRQPSYTDDRHYRPHYHGLGGRHFPRHDCSTTYSRTRCHCDLSDRSDGSTSSDMPRPPKAKRVHREHASARGYDYADRSPEHGEPSRTASPGSSRSRDEPSRTSSPGSTRSHNEPSRTASPGSARSRDEPNRTSSTASMRSRDEPSRASSSISSRAREESTRPATTNDERAPEERPRTTSRATQTAREQAAASTSRTHWAGPTEDNLRRATENARRESTAAYVRREREALRRERERQREAREAAAQEWRFTWPSTGEVSPDYFMRERRAAQDRLATSHRTRHSDEVSDASTTDPARRRDDGRDAPRSDTSSRRVRFVVDERDIRRGSGGTHRGLERSCRRGYDDYTERWMGRHARDDDSDSDGY